jgi:hypothetical protein
MADRETIVVAAVIYLIVGCVVAAWAHTRFDADSDWSGFRVAHLLLCVFAGIAWPVVAIGATVGALINGRDRY